MRRVRALCRSLGLRRHPLRRRVNVVQAWLAVALFVVIAAATPVVAVATGESVYAHGVQDARTALRERVPVTATLLSDATNTTPASEVAVPHAQYAVNARWYDTRGVEHTGEITPDTGGTTGQVVPIWIDASGEPVAAPLRHTQIVQRAVGIASTSALAFAGILCLLYVAVRRGLDHRRLEGWQEAWASVEPVWTGRRRGDRRR